MESLDELTKSGSSKKGFFSFVFNFNEETKEELLNIIQYVIIALIPVVILNKSIQRFIPEADDEKGTPEILAEVLIQGIIMFIGMFFIHRIIIYIPTYSGVKYPDVSIIPIILIGLIIILSLQTKIGEKVSILSDRVTDIWEGSGEKKNNKKNKKNVKVTQPISQNQVAINQSLNNQTTSLSQLPPPQSMSQTNTDYNNMYQQNNSPLVDSSGQGANPYESFGPMAANEALGGSGFGGANW
jgi:hypothetical protein